MRLATRAMGGIVLALAFGAGRVEATPITDQGQLPFGVDALMPPVNLFSIDLDPKTFSNIISAPKPTTIWLLTTGLVAGGLRRRLRQQRL